MSTVLYILLILASIAAYWAPTLVAWKRQHDIPNLGSIVVINLFLGWTLVGWVVALALAVRSRPPYMPVHVPGPTGAPRDLTGYR